jgi:hypothetical protein
VPVVTAGRVRSLAERLVRRLEIVAVRDRLMQGFLNALMLTVPKPVPRYRGGLRAYRYLSTVDLRFRVASLGERPRYRVYWTGVDKPRKCVRSTVDGYS